TSHIQFSASWISFVHTIFALAAFSGALITGLYLHYHKIVKNEWYGYPLEWWPSVSATIGDYYPERSLFHILIAFTSGPRLALVFFSYLFQSHFALRSTASAPLLCLCGLLRTISCGGWVYVTSSDHHDWHDVMMISYLVLTIPWQLGSIYLSPISTHLSGNQYRKRFSLLFFASIIPLVYFYVQHKVRRIPGVYDVLFDSCSILDFAHFEITFSVLSKGFNSFKGFSKIVSDICLVPLCFTGFVFWTTLTALGPTIFYFSVWSMGLDGMEVLLFSTLAPFLLCLPLLRTLLLKLSPILQILSLLSIGSYIIDRDQRFYDDSVIRLQLTASSVGICTFLSVIGFVGPKKEAERKLKGFGLGLILSVLIKYANYSLNPMWPIMRMKNGGYNRIGVILGLWANLEGEEDEEEDEVLPPCWRWWCSSIGLGALLFLIHTLFTDSGTMLAWVWDGYPVKGPTTVKHGYMMIIAMAIGVFIETGSPNDLCSHPIWYGLGVLSTIGLTLFHGWLGFSSGLILCIFSISQLNIFIRSLSNFSRPGGWTSIGLGFGISFLIYDLLELIHTFTVAYAFVPGGEIFREHTPIVLAVVIGLIGIGFFGNQYDKRKEEENELVEEDFVEKGLIRKALGALILGAVLVMWFRTVWKVKEVLPYHPEDRTLKAGIWTVHFGIDSGMWESQRRMRDIFQELELDVIGLLESDLQRIVMGNRDLTQFIAEDLGMYVDLGPGPNKHTWGAALLSKFPIVNSTHHLLPSPKGELAPAIHATLDVFGTMIDVIVSHNGQEEDPKDRELQSIELARIMREAYPRPFIFLGYVVSKPHAPRPAPYQILVEDGKMLDIERSDFDRWCEYILFRGLRRVGYARVTRGSKPAVSDTEIQVGSFQVPPDWIKVDPDRDLSDYVRIEEGLIKPSMRFSNRLMNQGGFKGHQYHVLKEIFGTDVVYYK
ncbi:uncharacterized protein MELLADRAFT_40407, partial [Melampsora larici-populina 98AG31]